MDDELCMKLADIGEPEALAACIIAHYPDIVTEVPLERIAEAVGIYEIVGQTTGAFEGVLVTDGAKTRGSIAYNNASIIERRRFTIAHELGHFLIPSHGASAQCAQADMSVIKTKDPNRNKEVEANLFAASLLMPKAQFSRAIRLLGSPETEHITALAYQFKVSKEAAGRRYTQLCDHACAVVFSHQGDVRYFCKTDTFPFLDINNGQPLPKGSLSARARGEPGHMSDWAEATPELWLGSSHRLRGETLYEQYFEQKDGYRLTMLTVDNLSDYDEPDEDAELEASWTPQFHRRVRR